MKNSRFQSIDALRALAALAVVFYHSSIPPFPIGSIGIAFYDDFLVFLGRNGRYGVDVFFVLSGFCIHWAHSKPGVGLLAKTYVRRRWWRIYPPYFFALGLAVLLNLITMLMKLEKGWPISFENFGPFAVLSHLFLVHNLFTTTFQSISGPFWTIAVEMQYYLLYLLARPLFFDKKGWVKIFLIAGVLYFIAVRLAKANYEFQPLQPFQYWLEWIAGAFLAYLLRNRPMILRYWPLYLVGFTGCLAIPLLTVQEHVLFLRLVSGIAFLILFFMRFNQIWSWPVFKWMPFVGIFSYSLYLTHLLLLDRIRTFIIPQMALGWGRFAVSVSSIALCLFLAYLFFLLFEKPFLQKSASIKCD